MAITEQSSVFQTIRWSKVLHWRYTTALTAAMVLGIVTQPNLLFAADATWWHYPIMLPTGLWFLFFTSVISIMLGVHDDVEQWECYRQRSYMLGLMSVYALGFIIPLTW